MPRAEENRLLARQFTVKKLLAHSILTEYVRAGSAIKTRTSRLVGRKGLCPRAQFELVKSARMNDRMAADGETLGLYFSEVSEVPSAEKRNAVGVTDIFRLNEKRAL